MLNDNFLSGKKQKKLTRKQKTSSTNVNNQNIHLQNPFGYS